MTSKQERPGRQDGSGRIPGAPASLRVQLSVQELMAQAGGAEDTSETGVIESSLVPHRNVQMQQRSRSNMGAGSGSTAQALMAEWKNRKRQAGQRAANVSQSMNGKASTAAGPSSRPQNGPITTDAQLLTGSILAQQRRKRIILQRQERLITRPTNSAEQLKRALTYFGPSSWTQVLHERHLAGTCGYPTCANKPALPEISNRKSALPADAPRYRISFATGSLVRDTADDPGGRNAFCSDDCWRKAEWVRRWVLSDELKGSPKSPKGKGVAIDRTADATAESGRFERRWTEDQWQEIELLEDVDPDRLVEGFVQPRRAPGKASPSASAAAEQIGDLLNGHGTKPSPADAAAMIDSLVIRERTGDEPADNAAETQGPAPAVAKKTPPKPRRSPHTKVRAGIGLQDLMGGGYVGKEASSELVRQIQATSRQGHLQVAQMQKRYEEDSDEVEEDIDATDEDEEQDQGHADELDEARIREKAEIARLMEQAMGIRDVQRETGALSEENDIGVLRAEWERRQNER